MLSDKVILRFDKVSFNWGQRPILKDADFSVRQGMKITLMGQNGAGKTTIFQMIVGVLKPEEGMIHIDKDLTMALSRQVIPREQIVLTVREFFETAFSKQIYNIEPRIKKILDVVHLKADLDKPLKSFSGGQQARLLLAQALIQNPDILLLDEPTNNLDKQGIAHLTQFLIDYPKTVIVISHDAEFLNSFTQGVLYLDIFTKKVERYDGNYKDVVAEIKVRLERERMKNVRLERDIQHRKDQANFFAQKGGHMRDVARKMNEKISELEGDIVELREEDKTIRQFAIPCQADVSGRILELESVSIMPTEGGSPAGGGRSASGGNLKTHGSTPLHSSRGGSLTAGKPVTKKVKVALKKKEKLLLAGPNGIGKTTLLETLATGHAKGEYVTPGIKVSYYRQDFSTLDFDKTVYDTLADAMDGNGTQQELRSTAAGFLLDAEVLKKKVGSLSEGQKGLVAFARISLERPGLLILDEPTNHINFRHLPVIAKALDMYEGAMILVSHVPDFVAQIKIDQVLDLEAL